MHWGETGSVRLHLGPQLILLNSGADALQSCPKWLDLTALQHQVSSSFGKEHNLGQGQFPAWDAAVSHQPASAENA